MFAGYVVAKKYQLKKQEFFPINQDASEEGIAKQKKYWKQYKLWKARHYLIILGKICAIAFPFYILAYIDRSDHLKSSISAIVFFGLLTLISFVAGRWLKNHYDIEGN